MWLKSFTKDFCTHAVMIILEEQFSKSFCVLEASAY